jgi:hypothetical protein
VADLNGKHFIALVRLSDAADRTIAAVGETCERVPAGRHGGTASDALAKLLNSGLIAPAPAAGTRNRRRRARCNSMAGNTDPPASCFCWTGMTFSPAKIKELRLKIGSVTEQDDGLGDNFESFRPVGKQTAMLTQNGGFFDTATNALHAAMATKLGTTPQATARIGCVGIMGNTMGAVCYGVSGEHSVGYEPLADLGKLRRRMLRAPDRRAGRARDDHSAASGEDGRLEHEDAGHDGRLRDGPVAIHDSDHLELDRESVRSHHPSAARADDRPGDCDLRRLHLEPDDQRERTVTVLSSTTFSVAVNVTVGGTGGTFVLASSVNGGAGYQQVSAFSGFTGFVGKIRHSADDTTYADLVTFTNVTSAPNAQRVTCAGTVNRYLCFDGDVTGSAGRSRRWPRSRGCES